MQRRGMLGFSSAGYGRVMGRGFGNQGIFMMDLGLFSLSFWQGLCGGEDPLSCRQG